MTNAVWRFLTPDEPVMEGDEFEVTIGTWRLSDNWRRLGRGQQENTRYRRRISQAFKPCSYRNPVAPPVKTHVVWAETPAVKHYPKNHLDADPGEGYRLVQHGEFISEGDQWWDPDLGTWGTLTGLSLASATKHCITSPLRRKLPAPQPAPPPGAGYRWLVSGEEIQAGDEGHAPSDKKANAEGFLPVSNESVGRHWRPYLIKMRRAINQPPAYRPYANAAEAAKALEGKLISSLGCCFAPVSQVGTGYAIVSGDTKSFQVLCDFWKFTDGTPCGIKTN